MAIRILQICPQLPPHYNGCGDCTDRLAVEFAGRGDESHVLTDDAGSDRRSYGVRSVGSRWDARAVKSTADYVRVLNPDLVLLHYTPFLYDPRSLYPVLALRALRARGYRTAVYAHEAFYGPSGNAVRARAKAVYLRARDRLVLSGADRIYVANETKKAATKEFLPSAHRRVSVLPFGANIEPDACVPERRVPQPPYSLVAFGIVMRRRRIDLLVRALSELARRGVDCRLRVIGRVQDARYAQECADLAQALGIAEALDFTGPLAPHELSEALSTADLFLHAAQEGAVASAGSLLAALAHGMPVIAVQTPYDDQSFRTAVVFSSDDAAVLADRIAEIVASPEYVCDMGARSRRLYEHEFGWGPMAQRLADSCAD